MYIYGPSISENIKLENNEILESILKHYNDSFDKVKQVQKTKDKIESRIKFAKYCK